MTFPDFSVAVGHSKFRDILRILDKFFSIDKISSLNTPSTLRNLSLKEIKQLEATGNWCDDWSKIYIADTFDLSTVRSSLFVGSCFLGVPELSIPEQNTPQEASVKVPDDSSPTGRYGIWFSTLKNCIVSQNTCIHRCNLVENTFIDSSAILDGSCVTHNGKALFTEGLSLPVGIEIGGRDLTAFPEINPNIAELLTRLPVENDLLEAYITFLQEYFPDHGLNLTYIGKGAVIKGCGKLTNSYVGQGTFVDGAELIEDSALLSSEEEPVRICSGSIVTNSYLQWGATVVNNALVEGSVLCEHSGVENSGLVKESFIAPNTHIGEGEITASFVGPFVGFHHQALLIATYWPGGRGNIGYGANVGSNHTSRQPDQELWPAEGMFFGLGSCVKFPANFSGAPYTIIATGVTTLPQKMEFPFSLISSPVAANPSIPPAYNQLIPAWSLSNNIYSLRRNEGKFKSRNRAKRSNFDFDMFRPSILEKLIRAEKRLAKVEETKDFYLPGDIDGIGKNYLLEEHRTRALKTYRFYIDFAVIKKILELEGVSEESEFAENISADQNRIYYSLYEERGLKSEGLEKNIRQFSKMLDKIFEDTILSRQKDRVRGERIIPDYGLTHPEKDAFIEATAKEFEEQKRSLRQYLKDLHRETAGNTA